MKIAGFQDRRLADSLYLFFTHQNADYRRDAVQAFGSLQDAEDVDRIGKLLLMDPEPSVRKAAAFALGQMQHPSCERILLGALVKEKIADITFEIFQAYGKTTKHWHLDPAVFLNDSTRSAGLAWSIYRAGLRGKTDSIANRVATGLLDKKYSENTRHGAAHFFGRGATQFRNAEKSLIAAAREDVSAGVRMAAALSLGKIPSDSSLATLKNIIKTDADARVIVNSIRALSSFPYHQTKHYLYEALNHKDASVGIAASQIILETIAAEDWVEVSSLTNQAKNWRVQANLYEAALKAGKNEALAEEIKNKSADTKDPYQRAALLSCLKHFPDDYPFVEKELRNADIAVVRSAAAATLVAMNYSKNFNENLQADIAAIFKNLMQSEHDPAVLGSIATALADSTLDYRSVLKDPAFLFAARGKLKLPEDIEALQPLEAAIAYFENRKPQGIENEFNHPVNWDLVKRIPDQQKATIKTTRGSIVVRLLVNESPGSVANFIELARKDYFDNKFFHRVVPNFVIQSGCKRGDGWGSEDYSIRSEFSPRQYRAGSVGMASAGKDTEGTQWFITHSPTPHLDGRYTIFAEVIEGMPVVEYIQVGDKVLDVVLENFPNQ
ncbi:MAG: peptidylprolyl isomerase [Cyclobacteriaceae bacterium]